MKYFVAKTLSFWQGNNFIAVGSAGRLLATKKISSQKVPNSNETQSPLKNRLKIKWTKLSYKIGLQLYLISFYWRQIL